MQNLQTVGKEMFTIEKNEKDPNLSKSQTFFSQFFMEARASHKTLNKGKLMYFSLLFQL